MTPLVLVHGLWDTPRLFRRLIQALDQPERPLLAPHLPHGLPCLPVQWSAGSPHELPICLLLLHQHRHYPLLVFS